MKITYTTSRDAIAHPSYRFALVDAILAAVGEYIPGHSCITRGLRRAMATKLIELADGVLVEIEVPAEQAQAISGGIADKVAATFDKVGAQLRTLCADVASDWKLGQGDLKIDTVEVELGLSFEAEGNVYLARTKGAGNLAVRVSLRPRE